MVLRSLVEHSSCTEYDSRHIFDPSKAHAGCAELLISGREFFQCGFKKTVRQLGVVDGARQH